MEKSLVDHVYITTSVQQHEPPQGVIKTWDRLRRVAFLTRGSVLIKTHEELSKQAILLR